MFSLKKSITAVGGLLVLAVALTTLLPLVGRGQGNSGNAPPAKDVNVVNTPNVIVANTATNPALIAEAGTHTGRAATEHVTLYRLGGGILQRVSSDGLPEGAEFVVPSGKVLVVTDFSWVVSGAPGVASTFRLLNNAQIVHVSTATLGSNGIGGESESITSGIVFASGTTVRWATTTATGLDVTVHGYLASAS
ncbi:MAG TPA: hypothetical protein VLB68_01555 [Pyrinomonadaceae bacterium]|nr:hypothetical protein [Pyrinomonadaceae bacterium]